MFRLTGATYLKASEANIRIRDMHLRSCSNATSPDIIHPGEEPTYANVLSYTVLGEHSRQDEDYLSAAERCDELVLRDGKG
jgi:hypothetical protein